MRGRPHTLLLALGLCLAAAPAAAQVVVAACADVAPEGVEVDGETAFAVSLQRDPTLAAAARIDFTAYDPDNINPDVPDYDGSEVLIRLEPSSYELPNLDGLTWGNFNGRSSSFTAPVPISALQHGINQVVFIDMNGSPFAVERLCVTLIDAPPPEVPPSAETFCASDVYAPSAIDAQSGADGLPADVSDNGDPVAIHVDVDVQLGADAQVGLDVVAFLNNNNDTGNHNALFTSATGQVGATFVVPNVGDHFVVRTLAAPNDLFGDGGEEDTPVSVELAAASDFNGRYWSACFLVEDDFALPLPDAGPPEADAGPLEDDAGVPPPDGGTAPLEDAGALDAGGLDAGQGTPADAGDAGVSNDAGLSDPDVEDDGGPRPDDGDGYASEEEKIRAQLNDPDFRVASSCAAAPAGPLMALWLLLWAPLARRRQRAR